MVGFFEGDLDGREVVGVREGLLDGLFEGRVVDGLVDGREVVGELDGRAVGDVVGEI